MGSSILNDAFLEVLPQKIDEYSFTIDWNPKAPTINFDYLKYTNSFDQVKEFSNQLHKDKLNVIIAHSQGNLIANELCYNNQKLNIQIVSIASPAGALPCNQFKNYALYDEDFVIENLKKITNRSFHYLKSNFSGYDHLLSGYLNNPEVLSHLNQTLTKTKNYIYDKNLNFNIYSDEPSFSFIDKDICVIKTIGDFKKIQSAFTGMALNNNGTKCFTLRNKHTFSDEEIKSLTLTSLGSNFNQIVSSLIQIYQNNPELIQHLPNIDYKKFINPVCNNLSVGSFYFISNQQKKKIIILKNDDGLFQFNVIDSSNGRNVSSSPFSLSCTRLQDLNKSNCTELVDYLSK